MNLYRIHCRRPDTHSGERVRYFIGDSLFLALQSVADEDFLTLTDEVSIELVSEDVVTEPVVPADMAS